MLLIVENREDDRRVGSQYLLPDPTSGVDVQEYEKKKYKNYIVGHPIMPKGLKETSSIISIGASLIESAANTFTSGRVDLQLNPLDNEVFVVYGIDLDMVEPDLVPGTNTVSNASLSTTLRTSVGGLQDSNVMASNRIQIQSQAGEVVRGQFSSDTSPPTQLDYVGIIATNDFFLNIQGTANLAAKSVIARVYGVRAKADSSVYAALVQSELLSA